MKTNNILKAATFVAALLFVACSSTKPKIHVDSHPVLGKSPAVVLKTRVNERLKEKYIDYTFTIAGFSFGEEIDSTENVVENDGTREVILIETDYVLRDWNHTVVESHQNPTSVIEIRKFDIYTETTEEVQNNEYESNFLLSNAFSGSQSRTEISNKQQYNALFCLIKSDAKEICFEHNTLDSDESIDIREYIQFILISLINNTANEKGL
ncbi:MAG: hypothetical protein OCC49_05740 [Fibrobacterales bacterium]